MLGFSWTRCSTASNRTTRNRCRSIGAGAAEIRISDAAGAFRVFYVAKFDDAVYVLHAFQKKTQQTSQADIDLARKRYKLIGKP
jgi:phage-related protein